MVVSDETQSKTEEVDGMASVLQVIMKKLESSDLRLSAMEVQGGIKSREAFLQEVDGRMNVEEIRHGEYMDKRDPRQTKVKFSMFDGNRVHDWLLKSERFFELTKTPPTLKVSLASVYLTGMAREWHLAFIKNRRILGPINWEEYSAEMIMRFDSRNLQKNIAQLKRLKEGDSFYEYVNEFITLVSMVELYVDNQVAMFLEGMKGSNGKLLMVLGPDTLQQAIALGKTLIGVENPSNGEGRRGDRYEWANSSGINLDSKWGTSTEPAGKVTGNAKAQATPSQKNMPYQPPHKRVSLREVEEMWSKGLYFRCDEKYPFGYKYSNRRLCLPILEPMEEEGEMIGEGREMGEQVNSEPVISFHVLYGVKMSSKNQIMKSLSYYKRSKLHMLEDSGDTQNVLDLEVVNWDFFRLRMEFGFQGRVVVSLAEVDPINEWKEGRLPTLRGGMKLFVVQWEPGGQEGNQGSVLDDIPTEIMNFSERYTIVFAERSTLSSYKKDDHNIQQKERVQSLILRPYRHFNAQKDIIEKRVQELLVRLMIDRIAKYVQVMALKHLFIAKRVASIFMNMVFKLQGLSEAIMSDSDTIFMNDTGKEFLKWEGVELQLSTTYHHRQMDREIEVNRSLETCLRCLTANYPSQWDTWLSLVEWWYNKLMGDQGVMVKLLRFHIYRSQDRMVQMAIKKRPDKRFEIRDWIYHKLQAYRQQSVVKRHNNEQLRYLCSGQVEFLKKLCGSFYMINT